MIFVVSFEKVLGVSPGNRLTVGGLVLGDQIRKPVLLEMVVLRTVIGVRILIWSLKLTIGRHIIVSCSIVFISHHGQPFFPRPPRVVSLTPTRLFFWGLAHFTELALFVAVLVQFRRCGSRSPRFF